MIRLAVLFACASLAAFSQPAPLAIAGCPVATGLLGTSYVSTVAASGGDLPFSWSVITGQLPPGVSLASSTGRFSGTPSLSGIFDFVLGVNDALGQSASRSCSITIATAVRLLTETIPDGSTNARYSFTLSASGGTGPYTWTTASGSLPPGLVLNPSTATISGQATQAGLFTFTIQVRDASGATAARSYSLGVAIGVVIPTCPAASATVGRAYSATLTAAGGQAPYAWSVALGAVPAGLMLSEGGQISGTPNTPGTTNFTIRVTDRSGAAAVRACAIQVAPELSIVTTSLPEAQTGVAYTATLEATGGTAPRTWTVSAGSLPSGLNLNSVTGQISGTAGTAGSFRFTARVTDAAGNQRDRQLDVSVAGGYAITACPTSTSVIGEPYSSSASLTDGDAPIAWTIASGSLPAGLGLNERTGTVAGAATTVGSFDFTLRAVDAASRTATRACSIVVNPASLRVLSTGRLRDSSRATPYSEALQVTGGRAPYTWSITNGTLPAGLALSVAGVIDGTPTVSGVYAFTVRVADANQATATGAVELRVVPSPAPSVSFGDLPDTIAPAQQPRVVLRIANPYPERLLGRLQLRFTPDSGLNVDDPAVTFVDGSRVMEFEIPANATEAIFPAPQNALQTGSVAGVIDLDVTLASSGFDVTPTPAPTKSIRVNRTAPVVTSVRVNPVSGGFEVIVVGFSSTREVTSATFQFTPATGSRLDTSQVTVQTEAAARQWFSDGRSTAFGGQFAFTQPFRVENVTLAEVGVTLTNAQGSSSVVRARF